ncbi:MAG: response regulator [Bryobacteraceae bacterium]|jgi:DNA-binding response OmpR family regulator
MATLLLVDDDPDQLAVRTLVLEREGYKVLAAADVASALAHRESDLVLMDLRLPTVEDGMNLIASIGSRAPIIVLTGAAVAGLPVARVLRKPCRTRVLLETIAEVLAET